MVLSFFILFHCHYPVAQYLFILLLIVNLIISIVFYVLAYYLAENVDKVVDEYWHTEKFQREKQRTRAAEMTKEELEKRYNHNA